MSKSPEEMAEQMRANVPEKTGKPMAQWLKLLSAAGLEKHGEMVKHLKGEYGVTHGFANLIVHDFRNAGTSPDDTEPDLVANQYSGAKAGLQPIYDTLIQRIQSFGEDVELAPKKAYVSLRRNKQFGLIQPSTRSRVDVGLNLKDAEPTGRLELSGSFNGMVSHRVRLESKGDVDDQLIGWLAQAYEAAS